MRSRPGFTAVVLLLALVLQDFGPLLQAQTAAPTPEELDQLLSPVALYPDSLLSQITTASTNPQEILDVDNWLQQNPDLHGAELTDAAEKQGFDPAFIALVNFPQVLEMMAQHIDDYAALGHAFSSDQEAVAASIQRLRAQAYEAGTLRTTEQQKVEVQQPAPGQTVYVIQPAQPQIVYVPVYDPTVVYIRPAPTVVVAAPVITFGVGIGIGALIVDNRPWGWGGWGWNWGARRAYYNHVYWGGWSNPYRPPNIWYRPRPVVYANRPGYRGNWGYRPHGYRPPAYGARPGYRHPHYGPNNRPRNQPGGNRPPAGSPKPVAPNRPRPNQPRPNQPTTPAKPQPTPSRPPTTQPANPGTPNRPGSGRPTTPGQTRPTPPTAQPTKPNPPNQPRPSRPAAPDQPKP
ncbi:MAG: DUF3300 domain-containing protein, partial [Terriglobales bacterium]